MILYVRTEHDPSAILASGQGEIHNIDPGLAVDDIRTATKIIDQALWWSKIAVDLLGVFGLLAVGLASVGLYGIMAYSVNQRRREIGVRMALGAGQGNVGFLVLRQGMTLVFTGLAVGVVVALLGPSGGSSGGLLPASAQCKSSRSASRFAGRVIASTAFYFSTLIAMKGADMQTKEFSTTEHKGYALNTALMDSTK
jgi:hypothetical protein